MSRQILNRTIDIDGVEILYREAGDPANPPVLLLHGFPTSSVMFKNLMTLLADRFHLIAPDYPGFGFSAFPDRDGFTYTFENIADSSEQAYGRNRTDVILYLSARLRLPYWFMDLPETSGKDRQYHCSERQRIRRRH